VVKLLAQLASRLPNLVQLLQPNFDDSEALLLRQGCAQSLSFFFVLTGNQTSGAACLLLSKPAGTPAAIKQQSNSCFTCCLFRPAVKLLAQLVSRLPNLVQLLQPNFDDSEALLLRQGCAQSLELALLL
jgi:hypothetical protein